MALRDYFNNYEYGAKITDQFVMMLQELQRIHDHGRTKEWRLRLAYVAGKFGLDPDVAIYFGTLKFPDVP